MISAYLAVGAAKNIATFKVKWFLKKVLVRYILLAFPFLLMNLSIYFLYNFGGLYNNQLVGCKVGDITAWMTGDINLLGILYFSLIKGMFIPYQIEYNPAMWMMPFIFFGYLVALIWAYVFCKYSVKKRMVWTSVAAILLLIIKSEFTVFMLGILAFDLGECIKAVKARKIIGGVLLLGAMVLGNFSHKLILFFSQEENWYLITWFSAAVFVFALDCIFNSNNKNESRVLKYMSRLSLPIWMIHIVVMCSIGSWGYLKAVNSGATYEMAIKCAFVSSIIATVLLCLPYVLFIEPLVKRCINKFIWRK